MPVKRIWAEAEDQTIRDMRRAGKTWTAISRVLSMNRNTVIERGRKLRAASPMSRSKPTFERDPAYVSDDLNRAPLAAGHPLTWGLISGGADYPKYEAPR